MDCIFCKIGKREIPADVIFESGDVMVFADAHPKAPVHLLLIPKTHIQSVAHLSDIDGSIVSRLILTARDVAQKKGLVGYKLLINVGRDGGQVVDHLHVHLLGGWGKEEKVDVNA